MASSARVELRGWSDGTDVAKFFLAELKDAHQRLFREMVAMDAVTGEARPDDAVFISARWKISQASLRRRTLLAEIVDFLDGRLDQIEAAQVKSLRVADQQLLHRSALHVNAWSIRTIREDWAGYSRASREIRNHMRSQILLEQATLYPMLRGHDFTRPAPLNL